MADDLIPSAPEPPAAPDPPDPTPPESVATLETLDEVVPADSFAPPPGDSMGRAPTDRYPGARPSPREPMEPEVWRARPGPPAPGPTLRQRLWWVLPFGLSFLAGVVFVAMCALHERSGHPGFTGKACFVTTIVAVVAATVFGPTVRWAVSPISRFFVRGYTSSTMVAACVLVFAVPPTVAWILLGMG